MAVPMFLRVLPLPFPSNHNHFLTSTRFQWPVRVSSREGTESTVGGNAIAAVVWFKNDLRIDDHPGLIAASRYPAAIPLYVFDHRIISRFSDEMLELLLFALRDLRNSLKDQGSNLMIRFGNVETIIPKLAKEVKATRIFAEEEIEYELQILMDNVQDNLELIDFKEKSPRVLPWNAPLYDIKNLKMLPASFHDFKKLKVPVLLPLLPQRLPALQMDPTCGTLPTLDDLKKFISENSGKLKDNWTSIKHISAEDILRKDQTMASKKIMENLRSSKLGECDISNYTHKPIERMKHEKSSVEVQQRHAVGGGTYIVLNTLAAYLRYGEGSTRDAWQQVHEKLCNAEVREGASFSTLFGSAIYLGIISRRRVHYEAIQYEKERNFGFLSLFGYSASTVAAATNYVCSMEWYRLTASRSLLMHEGTSSIRIWRWKGYIIQYAVTGHQGPAVILVHGFGAFLEHYRDNINTIAATGNRVWAITLLGFGKSEKPNVVYTEVMWAELIRDFIIEVVQEPVHLVGNSIGGYFISIVAGLWPSLAKSVVLLNGAGMVGQNSSSESLLKVHWPQLTSGASWLGARVLLLYLRLGVWDIVKKCYPNMTDRADDWLIGEMIRASYDPGAEMVLESIFNFNLSIPLDYLLKGFEGKVLVIQGMKDPLSNSKSKLAMLRQQCRGIVMKELDAGHCPHDELPDEVNSIIQEWIAIIEGQGSPFEDT